MRYPSIIIIVFGITYLLVLLFAGCSNESDENITSMPSRKVTVLELKEQDFTQESNLTGSVSLYRQEQISFEVSGRVLAVLDEGLEVEGPAYNEEGILVTQGQEIATLENTRYQIQVDALKARLEKAQKDYESVNAQKKLALQTLNRQKRILKQGAGFQQAVDDAQSVYDRTTAQLDASQANIEQVQEELEHAKEDLEDTILRAPFPGRITRIHVSQGAVVKEGEPIVTLTLMDPVKVQVEVSADDERQIQTGDRAIIYAKDPFEHGEAIPLNALVFEKAAVAEPKLRTFRIDLIVRNQRRRIDQRHPELANFPVVSDFLPVVKRYQGEPGPLFVHTDTVLKENGKRYVFRLPGVSFHPGATRSAVGKHIPEKIEISLGEQYLTVVKWNFRSLSKSDGLQEGDFLILNPNSLQLNGVVIGRPQWLLRPNDLVPVRFFLWTTPRGIYVPVSAITLDGDNYAVFIVEDGKASMKSVDVFETYNDLRRIEGEGIDAGTRLVVGGVHYISDDQPVTIVEQ